MRVQVNARGVKINNQMVLKATYSTITEFIACLRRMIPMGEMLETDPSQVEPTRRYFANYGIYVPVRAIAPEKPAVAAASIVAGAGSNNIELSKVDVTIVNDSYFAVKNWWYVNAIDNQTGDKFSYYLNLNDMKRYYKKGEEPRNFLRLDDLANVELRRLGLSPNTSDEEIIAKAKTRVTKKKVA